eukprot:EG_transcript_7375
MLQIMVKTSLFHLGPQTDVAVLAHHSWSPHRDLLGNVSHFILMNDETFFDMQHARASAERPPISCQSSANKLRIFQLLPSARSYDVIVMLDVDILVLANFLLLMGAICLDTLYVFSHHIRPVAARKTVRFFQSRDLTTAEFSAIQAQGLWYFNAGQFVLRPSAVMESLLWRAYLSFKLDPFASLYEQGHLNTVALLGCRVQYTLTHLGLLGLVAANATPAPAPYAFIHLCGYSLSAAEKVAILKRHLGSAFRSHDAMREGILQRILDSLNSTQDCEGWFAVPPRGPRHPPPPKGRGAKALAPGGRGKGLQKRAAAEALAPQPINDAGVSDARVGDAGTAWGIGLSPALTAAYSSFVAQHNVSHMCQVGLGAGRSAATSLFANPSAGLTVFDAARLPSAAVTVRNLRCIFPNRVVYVPGLVQDSLPAYRALVAAGQHPPCSTVLLPPTDLEQVLQAVLPVMAAAGRAFVAGLPPAAPEDSEAGGALRLLRNVACQPGPPLATPGGPVGGWCVGDFPAPHAVPSLHRRDSVPNALSNVSQQ